MSDIKPFQINSNKVTESEGKSVTIEKTLQTLIEKHLFAEREPLRDEILGLLNGETPSVLERKSIGDRILSKFLSFVDKFINSMVGK
jgi:type I restriction enzyme R subunit